MDRRDMLKSLGLGTAAGILGVRPPDQSAMAQTYAEATRGLPPLTITQVKAIVTAPQGIRLCVVKVETSEPGLYGLGCATFNQRTLPVVSAVDNYLAPFAQGRSAEKMTVEKTNPMRVMASV